MKALVHQAGPDVTFPKKIIRKTRVANRKNEERRRKKKMAFPVVASSQLTHRIDTASGSIGTTEVNIRSLIF